MQCCKLGVDMQCNAGEHFTACCICDAMSNEYLMTILQSFPKEKLFNEIP